MKTYSILFLLIFSFSAFGQSAKKINKRLLAELALEQQKQDSAYAVFSQTKRDFDSIKRITNKKANQLSDLEQGVKRLVPKVDESMNRLKLLGVDPNSLISSNVKTEDLPGSKEFIRPIKETVKTEVKFDKVSNQLNLDGLTRKEQNVLLSKKIEEYQTYSKSNAIRQQDLKLAKEQLVAFLPQLDSMDQAYQLFGKQLATNRNKLLHKLDEFRSNYAKKGPNGFPEVYRKVFPDVFPPKEEEMIREVDVRDIRGGEGSFFEVEKPPVEPVQADEKVLIYVEEPASFPGGNEAMKAFLAKNLRYPEKMKELNLSGRVYLKFIVLETGELSEIKVVRGLPDCKECDDEAIRVVKMMPKWIPGKNNGKAVKSYFNLPIKFMLD